MRWPVQLAREGALIQFSVEEKLRDPLRTNFDHMPTTLLLRFQHIEVHLGVTGRANGPQWRLLNSLESAGGSLELQNAPQSHKKWAQGCQNGDQSGENTTQSVQNGSNKHKNNFQ